MAKQTGSEAAVKEQRKKLDKIIREEDTDIKWCLGQPAVRRLLRLIIFDMAEHGKSCFTGNNTTFYNEGVRDVGNILVKRLKGVDSSALYHIENSVSREED